MLKLYADGLNSVSQFSLIQPFKPLWMRDSLLTAASKTNKSILNIRQLVQEVLKMKRDARALSFMWI